MPDPKKNTASAPLAQNDPDKETEHQIELEKLSAMKSMADALKTVGSATDFVTMFLKAIKGEKGEKGEPGKDADETKVVDGVVEIVKERIPSAEDVAAIITPEKVADIVLPLMPKPEDGKDGAPGAPGKDGVSPQVGDVVDTLKRDEAFLAKVKGEKGESVKGEPGKDGTEITGTQIVERINSGDAQIDASKIKNLFRTKGGSGSGGGYLRELADVEIIGEPAGALVLTWDTTKKKWVAQTGGSVPIAVDISSQFDGVATTFTLPEYSAILLCNITGWPPNGALRPTTDFTTPTSTSIALTSEVSAPESGATGIVLIIPA